MANNISLNPDTSSDSPSGKDLDQYAKDNQFGVSPIPTHNHDGVNSVRVDANTLHYAVPYFRLFVASTTPTALVNGAIAAVNGKLMICNGTSWVIVGTQS